MRRARRFGLTLLALGLAGAGLPAPPSGDPVTEARGQRAAALGIAEGARGKSRVIMDFPRGFSTG